MACFINTGIDHLILHDTLVSKTSAHRFVAPLVRTYMDIAGLVSASTR
jgi:carbamoyltransferase